MTVGIAVAGIAAFLAVTVIAIVISRAAIATFVVYSACLIISSILLLAAGAALVSALPPESHMELPLGVPWLGAHLRTDALSAFFLVVINLGGATASLYALGYGRHEPAPQRVLPFYSAFLAGMNTVIIANDAFTFLVAWEFMSLTSWALVVSHHREHDNVYAGYVYLIMAGLGTFALLLGFGLLAGPQGAYTFAAIREAPPAAWQAGLVLILILIGAGSKAGLVPLHVWLPLAHPAAPSHVSALLSGVMTKVAVYGFIRIAFDLIGSPAWWWGVVILALAGITTVMGVLYALMQHDLKRLLAYHTVENIGIIFIGLGLAVAFKAHGMAWAAALSFTAALLHVFNHSLFKSLLFFGAGAVLGATGERDMERLGGLIHRMPQTAFVFLVGCAAISALPPLNGFVSEWLTFQAILLSPQLPSWSLKFLVPSVGALLALSAALAAACFVKAFGVTFLGRPRTPQAATARETDSFSLAAMFILAALCLIAGIVPGFFIDALSPAVSALVGDRVPAQAGVQWLSIVPIAEGRSSYNGLLVFIFMTAAGLLTAYVIHRIASDKLRRSAAWDCGYPDASTVTQYTATSFAQPIRRVFGTIVFSAREHGEMPPPGDLRPARLVVDMRDLVWDLGYAPVAASLAYATERLNRLQFLTIRQYLSLVFGSLVTLLLVLAIWP